MKRTWVRPGRMRALLCIALAALIACAFSTACAGQAPSYSIAVIPSSPPVTLHIEWAPFLERLTKETGLNFRLKLFDNMAAFEREIAEGNSDFIFASPIQAVVAHQTRRYQPLVRGGKLVSIGLFVRSDSAVRTIDDLSNQSISFVGNKNVCSVLIRHLLAEQKDAFTFTTEYSGSTRNVIKSVLLGKSAAGAVFIPELDREPAESRALIRAIVETPKIPPHPLCAHPRVPWAVREQVKKAILALAASGEGAELLKQVRLRDPVAADYQKDYLSLEVIDIKRLTDWGK